MTERDTLRDSITKEIELLHEVLKRLDALPLPKSPRNDVILTCGPCGHEWTIVEEVFKSYHSFDCPKCNATFNKKDKGKP